VDPEVVLEVLRKHTGQAVPIARLMRDARIPARKEKELKRLLKGLVSRGVIERERGRKYRLSRAGQIIEGRVMMDRRGRAHLIPKNDDRSPIPLLYQDGLAPQQNDVVKAELVYFGRERRRVARLTEIIERPYTRHVGVLRHEMGAEFVDLEVGGKFTAEVLIPPGQNGGAAVGDMVEVEFAPSDNGRNMPVGHVKHVLGPPGERDTEMKRLLIEHGLDRPFPPAALAEAESFGTAPTEADIQGRRDVRHLPLVTIDGETAKDFDDAVCAVKEGRDHRLYVAIADVSHYVRIGSALDEEAFRRGTSVYLTDRAIPMLPEALSNGLCSLNPRVDRLCMLADIIVDPDGRIKDATFHRAVMRSQARLTYTRVAAALEGEPDEACREVMPTLLNLAQVSRKLLERRLRRGSIDLDVPEPQVVFDDYGLPVDTVRRPRNEAHRIIEDLMIAANEAVAHFFLDRERPTMFRVHERPDAERLMNFARLCSSLGVRVELSDDPTPSEVAGLLARLSEHPNGRWLHGLLLRSLAQARYAAENLGHFGLASSAYLHFTSPIRRYPDLIVHRQMKQVLDDQESWYASARLEEMAGTCSDSERKAMQAERGSLELDRALVAAKRIGERLPARIGGVQAFGLFASVIEPFIDGLIPVQSLPSDYYEMDEFGSRLVGANGGLQFALGDPVEVEVVHVNVARRQVELRLVESASSPPRPARSARPPTPRPRARPDARKASPRSGRRGRPKRGRK
jgi:ribonuclease R